MFSNQNIRERRVGQAPMAPQHLIGMPPQQGPSMIMSMPAQQMPIAMTPNHYPNQNYSNPGQNNLSSYIPQHQVPLPQKSNYHQPTYNHNHNHITLEKPSVNKYRNYRKDYNHVKDSLVYNLKEKNNYINKEYHSNQTFSRYHCIRKNGYYYSPVQKFTARKYTKYNGHILKQPVKTTENEPLRILNYNGKKVEDCPVISRSNIKEKTPMCLVNELARFNKITHQYRLTDEQGPAHKKSFTVTLTLGTEEYTSEGPSIKKAQHSAAAEALAKTLFPHPTPKTAKNSHSANITPTVELNALAMKRGEPAIYKVLESTQYSQYFQPQDLSFGLRRPFYGRNGRMAVKSVYSQNIQFMVSLKVGSLEFFGEGMSPQSARHNAASKALNQLKTLSISEGNNCSNKSEKSYENKLALEPSVKSPISLVYEMALKRNCNVIFEVVSDRGPPHMKVFVTKCTVGKITATGEGNGKKISKKRAAENMLIELKKLPPVSPTFVPNSSVLNRGRKKFTESKKKSRNLLKVVQNQKFDLENEENVNPIARLIQIQQLKKEKEPFFALLEEKGTSKQKEFVMQVTAGQLTVTGTGPNKKLAKKNAAHNLLVEMGCAKNDSTIKSALKSSEPSQEGNKERKVTFVEADKQTESNGTGGSVGRQVKPGIYLMSPCDQQCSGSGNTVNPVINMQTMALIARELLKGEKSPTADALQNSAHNKPNSLPASSHSMRPKDRLIYLAKLLDFQVHFSDFPKGNHSEFLSLVTMSTDPSHVCHGYGSSIEDSQDQAAITALTALSEMAMDSVSPSNPTKVIKLKTGKGMPISTK